MKLALGSLFLVLTFAVAATAVPATLPNDPIATTPEQSGPSKSGSVDPTSVPAPPDSTSTSDPSATNTPSVSSSGPPPSSNVSPTSTDSGLPTSVEISSIRTQRPTSSSDAPTSVQTHDSPTPSSDAPTSTLEQPSTTSDVTPTSDTPQPTQTSSSSSAPSQPTTAPPQVDKQAYLDQHNLWRRTVGASDLQWSDDLAAKAQNYAEQCQLKHSDGALGPVGENLAAATGSFDAKSAVELFVQDRNDFSAINLNLNHFTQVIWSSTTQLGCGVAPCGNIFPGQGDATYHVCLYNPVGNVVGEQKLNLPHFSTA